MKLFNIENSHARYWAKIASVATIFLGTIFLLQNCFIFFTTERETRGQVKEYLPISPMTSTLKNTLTVNFDEEKNVDYSYCSGNNRSKDWMGQFLIPQTDALKNNFIPSRVEDAPIGVAASIPKAFLIEEKDYCINRPHMKAVAFVHTAISNVQKRKSTRLTWGGASAEIGVVFMVGLAKNKDEQDIITAESQMHHDIVQGNYTDLYQFLVYKALNALYWITKNCNKVKWVIHADDDVLLDVKKYLNILNNDRTTNSAKKIFCNLMCNGVAVRDDNKWRVSEKEYPYDFFPIYCMGNLWFTSMEVIKSLLDAVPAVKYVWVDDAFVTGLLAEKAGVRRYRIDIPDNFHEEHIGKVYGWRQEGEYIINHWMLIRAYYNRTSNS